MSLQLSLALIGFGEAGYAFASDASWHAQAKAFDIDVSRTDAMRDAGVEPATNNADALADAQVVLSLVTADSALDAARQCAPHLNRGTILCDMNSVAPETKRAAAEAANAAGGRYIDVAVMAPVKPKQLSVPLLISGPGAQEAEDALRTAGFSNCRVVGEDIGRASAIKLCRSIIVKGMEALSAEMALAARSADVFEEVVASLDTSEKSVPWAERVDYSGERMRNHGLRRAAEMDEAGRMLEALGIEPIMTRGTIERQRLAGKQSGSGS